MATVADRVINYSHTQSFVEESICYYQLQYFLYANMLTGFYNLVYWTYYEELTFSFLIMMVHFSFLTWMSNQCRKCRWKAAF